MQGDPPDDLTTHPEDDPDDDGPMRGWVPPDDRLWLHPSERASGVVPVRPAPPPDRSAGGRWVAGGVATCVLLSVVVTLVLVATDGSRQATTSTARWVSGVPTTEAYISPRTEVKRMTTAATPAHDSTVGLLVERASGTTLGTGVVAEAGGIIVALQPVVAGARAITVVEPDGTRQAAIRVGSDATTGITVLRITDDLPAATVTDGDPATGTVLVAMAMESQASNRLSPVLRLYAGTVLFAGVGAATWQGTGFCTTGVATPLSSADLGAPLVDASGAVTGILEAVVGKGSQRTSMFLPAELVRDVAAQIVSHGSVAHGSIGLQVSDASPSPGAEGGAMIESVASDGAAAVAGLRPGDVVVEVDGQEVKSEAELVTRLYGDPPGAELRLAVLRDGATVHTDVVLTQS